MAPDDTGPDDLGPDDFDPEEFEDFHDDGPRYSDVSELGGMEIPAALQSGKAKMLAIAPGYGRINSWCGTLDYELNSGRYILGYVNRRDIADSLRAIPSLPVPSDEELESFDAFMKGPPD